MELTIFALVLLLVVLLFVVSGKKGFRSLFSLVITAVLLIVVVVPLVIHGADPVLVVFLVSLPMTALIIYLTEGFGALSHLSIVLTIINFVIISALIDFSIVVSKFTGIVSEEASTVGGLLGIDLPKLLIASIMLSTLGALIEMVVTQVGTVIELINANPETNRKQVYEQSYTVGIIHLGSIINTLFLVYAGILLPTLIVFSGSEQYLFGILNYEPVSSEIIRMIVGTIGLIIAMPMSTYISVRWLKRGK